MNQIPADKAGRAAPGPLIKLIIELGPLLVFFLVNARFGIMAATSSFMVAIIAALTVNFALTRKLAPIPVFTAVFVMIFGGLTLYLNDDTFIKIKPTLINLLFAAILGAGLAFNKLLLRNVMGAMVDLTERGWRLLTYRWVIFFIAMALLNEVVWRSVSTDNWVNFKVFALLPLTIAFALLQTPFLQRHMRSRDASTR